MTEGLEIEENAELDEELGIDYHTLRGNPSFSFRGLVGGGTREPSDFVKAKAAPVKRRLVVTPADVGVTIRERVDAVDLTPKPTAVSRTWDKLGKMGLGRHGCPLEQVDPFAAELNKIRAALALAEVQREATSEHNKLRRIDAYRARVLLRLRALLARRCG